ncbi:MAG TPA: bifunctional nuclease family protein [Spirochaetia bacterium]|nr:bifunctional nuclease family protein [Spirochaetia bacterium]
MTLSVKGIALEHDTHLPLLLLQCTDEGAIIPIPVGPAEASSIIIEIEGVLPPRPLTHDLIVELFRRHRMRPRRLEIYDLMQGKHLARLVYTHGLRTRTLEVRPSDGVAIALRLEMPIVADESIVKRSASASLYSYDDLSEDSSEILYLVSQMEAQAHRP